MPALIILSNFRCSLAIFLHKKMAGKGIPAIAFNVKSQSSANHKLLLFDKDFHSCGKVPP